jgi:ABC-type transporter Mla subunit MlaD
MMPKLYEHVSKAQREVEKALAHIDANAATAKGFIPSVKPNLEQAAHSLGASLRTITNH